MKKFSLTTIPVLIAAVSSLSADSMGNKCSKNASTQTTTQPMHTITPSANPMVEDCCDPFITADFIWWRAQEDGLNFAYTGGPTTGAPYTATVQGKVVQPRFRYEPGFKVGAGLKFKHDGWDLYANYTWLHTYQSKSRRTQTAPSATTGTLNSNYFVDSGTDVGLEPVTVSDYAQGSWKMHFNVLDAELGRNFWISEWMTLRPHFGMKFSWIKQDFDVAYVGAPSTTTTTYFDSKQKQFGVGLRAGLDVAFYMWKKWCIYGELAVSEMLNYFRNTSTDVVTTPGTTLNTKRHSHPVTGILEMGLGLRFETTFHNDDYLFMLQAGWEEQVWFNQNQLFSPLNTQAPTDLSFEGLTIKAGFDF